VRPTVYQPTHATMVWVSRCCCCHLKGGVIAIGCVFLVLNVLGVASAAIQLKHYSHFWQFGGAYDVLKGVLDTSLAMYAISAIVAILLFVPACQTDENAKNKRFFLIPFMVWTMLNMLAWVGLSIWYITNIGFAAAMFVICVYLIYIGLGIYCKIMVYSYYQHLRDFNPEEPSTTYSSINNETKSDMP